MVRAPSGVARGNPNMALIMVHRNKWCNATNHDCVNFRQIARNLVRSSNPKAARCACDNTTLRWGRDQ
jgi:hypothetical protein